MIEDRLPLSSVTSSSRLVSRNREGGEGTTLRNPNPKGSSFSLFRILCTAPIIYLLYNAGLTKNLDFDDSCLKNRFTYSL